MRRQTEVMAESAIRILAVDDHPVFREGLVTIIASQPDMTLAGEASNAADAVSQFKRLRPDVTLLDLRLPGADGVEALRAIRQDAAGARVIVLTTSDSDGAIQQALRAGAAAYVLKSMPKHELLEVIRAVHGGRRYIPADVAARIAEHMGEEDLSGRELEVLRLIRDGHRNKEIADRLGISESTVKFHIKHIADKLGASDRTHAVTLAIRRGLLHV